VCLTMATVAGAAAASAAGGASQPVVSSFDLESPTGVTYRVFMAVPEGEPPAGGYPVVYLIDGNTTFSMARKTLAEHPAMRAALVGIGYPSDDRKEIVRLRYFDLTPPTPADLIPLAEGMAPPRTGGVDAFFRFVEKTLKPEIERRLPVDRARQTLFGHSLGGLFALHVLYSQPDAFQTYIAADPSIWWNGRSILEEQKRFLSRASAGKGKRLLIETSGKRVARPGTDAATAGRIETLRSGPNGRDVYEALAASGLERAFRRFPEESHGSMVPLSVADALRFSLLDASPVSEDDRPAP
ncbi:MAG: alpha/beta hydrolase, partial [Delftia acidovorans]|nr:alpha/beta hydrolase [Delftia acidovorans]